MSLIVTTVNCLLKPDPELIETANFEAIKYVTSFSVLSPDRNK